ncbi:hypothetical protein PQ472_07940 [Lacticaseibacillus pabuli]|uniref:Uncharacterized protein n=1 Tax=Lacticaseibacillus pabuli TaxID=3025672 RepID=A0ABY7WP26_9LACO|nr:hypothetical protein [Lacticaseibacillus sp. KACC 23028]WDF81856.1 hypothetical protein PQ472_07940 [Lacticaseibacillus sp. KACC 23028]
MTETKRDVFLEALENYIETLEPSDEAAAEFISEVARYDAAELDDARNVLLQLHSCYVAKREDAWDDYMRSPTGIDADDLFEFYNSALATCETIMRKFEIKTDEYVFKEGKSDDR